MSIYKQAAKSALRFTTTRGEYTAEDLFTLSLKDLDTLAVGVNRRLKGSSEETFLENPDPKKRKEIATDELRLEILKDVITTKQDENKAAVAASLKRTQKEFLTNLRNKRQLDQMEALSMEDIEKQLAELEAGE